MYRILIVDDEKIERNGIRLLLGRQGRALDIAEAVNCSRSSIARVCRALKQAGVIVSEGVGFRIVDHAGLSALRGKYVSFR